MSDATGFVSLPRQKRLSALAADHLAQMIAHGQLPLGGRLPPERQLGELLAVSRTVVREAIKTLEARGLVQADAGGGVIVRGVSHDPVTDSLNLLLNSSNQVTSFEDVQAVRGVLEVGIAVLAAQKATEEDIARMQNALEAMVGAQSPDGQIQADFGFHFAIAEATHNHVFAFLLHALNDVIVQGWREYWQARSDLAPDGNGPLSAQESESNEHHMQLLDAIRRHSTEEARDSMTILLAQWAAMYGQVHAK